MDQKLDFDPLVIFLKNAGYAVEVTKVENDGHPPYMFAFVGDSQGITLGFCTKNGRSYRYIDGRLAADNSRCFDKWSKCPLIMNLPVDGDVLLKHLNWLSSEEGFEFSNSYDYLKDTKRLPYDLRLEE